MRQSHWISNCYNDYIQIGLLCYMDINKYTFSQLTKYVSFQMQLKPMQDRLRKEWPSFTCPQIGRKFWVHEWNKHGTCSKSVLGEVAYFQAALSLKNRVNILQALTRAGIHPNNRLYPLKSVKKAIARATGFHPWVVCNRNSQGVSQIWQVSVCVNKSGTKLINCPFVPKGPGDCESRIKFPSF